MSSFLSAIPTHLDFAGQRKAERLFQILVLLFAAVGLAVGYHYEQFSYTVYSLGAGFLLSCLLTLPPWPMYRRHPLKWKKANKSQESKSSTPTSPAPKPPKKKK
ncbi:signal peptidase complex subunit Spase12 [Brevipalpus obovatus]|uniref:signal peptidase complex subunit Spase12 n=1 Tax=Brevipalpus obovatus TaxID=246614 RepID=UPI003D9E9209